jgi:hypothetical protein
VNSIVSDIPSTEHVLDYVLMDGNWPVSTTSSGSSGRDPQNSASHGQTIHGFSGDQNQGVSRNLAQSPIEDDSLVDFPEFSEEICLKFQRVKFETKGKERWN